MRAVAELGYRPNAAARLLAERQSRTVGVLLNDLHQPWFADMLDGLTPALQAGGKHILLGDGRIDRMMDETLTWSFLDLGVDGLILAGSIPISQAIFDIGQQDPDRRGGRPWPGVWICRTWTCSPTTTTWAGTLAVRHLLDLGHTRIAHISGLPSTAGSLRMQGYQDTMRAVGLGGLILVETGDMTEEGGYRAAVRLLSRPDRPTAIFAANDLTCVGALSAAAALGVQVPGGVVARRLRQFPAGAAAGALAHQRRQHSLRDGPAGRPDAAGAHRAPGRARRDPADAAAPRGARVERSRPQSSSLTGGRSG